MIDTKGRTASGRPIAGGSAVARNDRRNLMRAALVGVVIAGLALSACGRKGGLEPPPGAKAADTSTGDPVADRQAQKPDRPFILDGLL
jgi:predicted small lipoprotein YifL